MTVNVTSWWDFSRTLCFPPPIKLTSTIKLKYSWTAVNMSYLELKMSSAYNLIGLGRRKYICWVFVYNWLKCIIFWSVADVNSTEMPSGRFVMRLIVLSIAIVFVETILL